MYGRIVTAENVPMIAMEFGVDNRLLTEALLKAQREGKRIYLNESMTEVDVVLVKTFPKKRPW